MKTLFKEDAVRMALTNQIARFKEGWIVPGMKQKCQAVLGEAQRCYVVSLNMNMADLGHCLLMLPFRFLIARI